MATTNIMTSSRLADLPTELLNAIIDRLSRHDIYMLTRVCKSMNIYLVPILYSDISWTWTESLYDNNRFIRYLVRTLVESPQLGSLINRICFRGTQPALIFWDRNRYLDEEAPRIRRFLSKVSVTSREEDEWISELAKGDPDAFVALLLACAPNLKHLDLGYNFIRSHVHQRFITLVLQCAICWPQESVGLPSFALLQEVSLGLDLQELRAETPHRRHYVYPEVDLDLILPLLYLPGLTAFNTLATQPRRYWKLLSNGFQLPFLWPTEQALAPALRTLVLHNSSILPDVLVNLLSATPNLQRLVYEARLNASRLGDWQFQNAKLEEALYQVKATIEHLRVSIVFFEQISGKISLWESWRISGKAKSFIAFEQLRSLEVPFVFFFGRSSFGLRRFGSRHRNRYQAITLGSLLPKSLTSLCLTDSVGFFEMSALTASDWHQQVQSFLGHLVFENHDSHTPKLKIISDGRAHASMNPQDLYQEIGIICRGAGFELNIEYREGTATPCIGIST